MRSLGPEQIRQRFREVSDRVAQAASRADRLPESVRIVVVTKGHPLGTLRAVLESGVSEIGENYAQEAVKKMQALGVGAGTPEVQGPVRRIRWHMIGHVQSRKADLVAAHFDMLHALDSRKLASRLDRFAGGAGRTLPVLLECNLSGEASKFGFPCWEDAQWPLLADEARGLLGLRNISIRGLMTMPPYPEDPEQSRPYFQRLRDLRDFLRQEVPETDWDELSMGTSDDFTVAVEEGATLVRVGTAILGPRPQT